MKAVVQDRYGTPADLRVADVPRPEAGAGQVLVRVHAASLHADVWHVLTGRPYLVARLLAGGLRRPRNPIPGTDLAGVVEALGPGAHRFAPGDRVFGEVVEGNQWHNGGAFAEYLAVDESKLETVPDELTLVEAATIPTSGLIAYQQVLATRVTPGDHVLVNGAAGGVGLFVVQIAKARGAVVTGVDAADRRELLTAIGVDRFIDYRVTDFTAGTDIYDAIIDIPGNQPFGRIARVLADDGRYVLVGHDRYGTAGRKWVGSVPTVLGRMAREAMRTRKKPSFASVPADGMAHLASLAQSGALRPAVAKTFPLTEVSAAMEYLTSGTAVGKVVLTV